MKACSSCLSSKEETEYYKDNRKSDGLYPSCKSCHKIRTARWRQKNKAYSALLTTRWLKLNPERVRFYQRKHDAVRNVARKERRKSDPIWRRYRQEHEALYRECNRMRIRKASQRWRRAHPDRVNNYTRITRARRRTNGGDLTIQQWLEIKTNYQYRCAICNISENERPLTMDHIIPVLHGGQTTKTNIQPLCQSCNSRKFTNFPAQMDVSTHEWKIGNLL